MPHQCTYEIWKVLFILYHWQFALCLCSGTRWLRQKYYETGLTTLESSVFKCSFPWQARIYYNDMPENTVGKCFCPRKSWKTGSHQLNLPRCSGRGTKVSMATVESRSWIKGKEIFLSLSFTLSWLEPATGKAFWEHDHLPKNQKVQHKLLQSLP